jgi:hypothetical protein
VNVWLDRRKMDGLIKGAVRRSGSGRLLTDLSHDLLYARMPADRRALLLGTCSGGDEMHSVSRWVIPGIGRRELIVDRAKLAQLIREAEPWAPPAAPEVRARQSDARERLRRLRGLAADEGQMALL